MVSLELYRDNGARYMLYTIIRFETEASLWDYARRLADMQRYDCWGVNLRGESRAPTAL
jgi:hypothetical protein